MQSVSPAPDWPETQATLGSASYGLNTESSGDYLSTTETTTRLVTSTEYLAEAGDNDVKPVSTPTEAEINSETENNTSIELNYMTNDTTTELAGAQPALMFCILLILLIIFFVICHKRKKSKQDELESENVKSPIFEEDTPSVMEVEMEELDKWMNNMNKNGTW
uniref:Transmembrane protein 154 n=1 Tax=Pelodiscus sinensis TaxID=13735 RepID=K7GG82_PELSI